MAGGGVYFDQDGKTDPLITAKFEQSIAEEEEIVMRKRSLRMGSVSILGLAAGLVVAALMPTVAFGAERIVLCEEATWTG